MSSFTLDTSGRVMMHWPEKPHGPYRLWSDLDAFTQGYIEALFASSEHPKETYRGHGFRRPILAGDAPTSSIIGWRPLGFSDLAPEALAAILKDCAARRARFDVTLPLDQMRGRMFWSQRQAGTDTHSARFPPLTPYLGDDGRVYLREDPAK